LKAIAIVGALTGCNSTPASPPPDKDTQVRNPGKQCTELEDVARTWLGESCEHGPELRELHAIGDGFVMDWTPRTRVARVWALSDDPQQPLGADPVNSGAHPSFLTRTTIIPIGKSRVLLVQTDRTDVSIFTVNTTKGARDVILPSLGNGRFEDRFNGHGMLGLGDDYFLDYRKGTGGYRVGRVDETQRNTPQVLANTPFRGLKAELRRGARVVNLGQQRLLEWVPLTGRYRIWEYSLDPARTDIFDAAPVAQGQVPPDVTANHDLLVPAPNRLLLWRRDDGNVQLRALDPLAADPFAGAVIGEHRYPQLESPDFTAKTRSAIEHLVVVLQRGRSFDSYFGKVCQAAPGSNPVCQEGAACCEAMPASIPGADACTPLDTTMDTHAPKADFACMEAKVMGPPLAVTPPCGDPKDFACTPPDAAGAIAFYHQQAENGALADRYFQTTLDGEDQNLIYLSKTTFGSSLFAEYGLHLTVVMSEAHVRWAMYLASADDTRNHFAPEFYDHHWDFFRAVTEIDRDVQLRQLPAISIVVAGPEQSERPGAGPAGEGIRLVEGIVSKIASSPHYAPRTLVLLTHLTSGGFFDHVTPPPAPDIEVDTREGGPVAYGPRVPLLAVGRFARRNHVSHVQLELSSVTKFIEWNWKNGVTGQLGGRDQTVSNIGSLLDPAQTGEAVP
jgi:hypothetical protein